MPHFWVIYHAYRYASTHYG